MVDYNPKSWWKLIFQLHKTDTFRTLFWIMISVGIFTLMVVFAFENWFPEKMRSTTTVHSLLGFVISLLLVFRTNTAYDRWWEGRKQWGALVNTCRNLAMKTEFLLQPSRHENLRKQIIAYPYLLKEHLRDSTDIDKEVDVTIPSDIQHRPNYVASLMHKELRSEVDEKNISPEMYLAVQNDISKLTDILGACERIKKTPIPYTYSIFIKKFVFIYTITMPFGFAKDFGYYTIPLVIFVFYALASLEVIAEEIENPFGLDPNDLPLESMSKGIDTTVNEIFGLNKK